MTFPAGAARRSDPPAELSLSTGGILSPGSMRASWSTSLAGRGSEQAELCHAGGEQLVDQLARPRFIDREVQRSCGALVTGELRRERWQNRAAVRQIAQVILERGKPGDSLAVDRERRVP